MFLYTCIAFYIMYDVVFCLQLTANIVYVCSSDQGRMAMLHDCQELYKSINQSIYQQKARELWALAMR